MLNIVNLCCVVSSETPRFCVMHNDLDWIYLIPERLAFSLREDVTSLISSVCSVLSQNQYFSEVSVCDRVYYEDLSFWWLQRIP